MDAWDNFFCILGKVFLSLIIGVVVFFLLCCLDKWMNKSEAKEIQSAADLSKTKTREG